MALLALAILAPIALTARIIAGRWLHPGAMFAGYWLLAGVLPVFVFGSHVSAATLALIAVGAAVFSLGALAATPREPAETADRSFAAHPRLRLLVVAGVVAGLLAGVLTLHSYGLSPRAVFSASLFDVGSTISQGRYIDHRPLPTVVPALLGLTHCAAIVAPFAAIGAKRRWPLIAGPAVSLLFYGAATTQRFPIMLAAGLTSASFLAVHTLRRGAAPAITRRGALLAIGGSVAAAAVFVGLAFVRIGNADPAYLPFVERAVGTYAFGYEPALSSWLATNQQAPQPPKWGAASFAPAALALGGGDRVSQFRWSDFTMISDTGQITNVYSAWRGLIVDFGEPGAVLALFALGSGLGVVYRRTSRNGSPTAAAVLACGYSTILMSAVLSIVTFTNVCAAIVLAVVAIRVGVTRTSASCEEPSSTPSPCS